MRAYNIAGCLLTLLVLCCVPASAQKAHAVQWLTFEQLEDSLSNQHADKPKRVFIDFYTDWCTYCRKMDKVVFTKPEVIELLNEDYYAVRFDAESEAAIAFGGQSLINDQVGKSRSPIHQIAQLLASRDGQFAPPVMVVLDEEFKVLARHFSYMDSKRLIKALSY